MVTVILRGGLGNQMFQYAAGFALAKKSGARLLLDTTFLNDRFPRPQFTYRKFDLDVFNLIPEFTGLSRASSSIPIPGLWLGMDLISDIAKDATGLRRFVKEREGIVLGDELKKTKKRVVLWGFWQSPRYFEGAEDDLKNEFTPKEALGGEAEVLAKQIADSNSVSLHVRRGDYLLPKYRATYGDTDLVYYAAAVDHIKKHIQNPKFFVFSDDIEWCRANLTLDVPAVYVDNRSAGPKNSFHLHLMSLCKHNIIANSTFSWWGAWLNRNSEKIVVAPHQWRADTANATDIIPAAWILI